MKARLSTLEKCIHAHTYRILHTSLVAQMVKHLPTMWETWVWSLCWEDPLEKEMATHSSTLAWKIPWWRSLVGYTPWGHKELDTTERLHIHMYLGIKKTCLGLDVRLSCFLVNYNDLLGLLGLQKGIKGQKYGGQTREMIYVLNFLKKPKTKKRFCWCAFEGP